MQIYTEQNSRAKQTIRGSIANNTSWTQQSPTIVIVLQNREQKLLVRLYTIQQSTTQVAVMFMCKENIRAYHMHINWLQMLQKHSLKCMRQDIHNNQPLFVAISQTMTNYHSSCAHMWQINLNQLQSTYTTINHAMIYAYLNRYVMIIDTLRLFHSKNVFLRGVK